MRYEYINYSNKDFIGLCHELDNFLNKIVGGEENREEYVQYNQLDDIHNIVLAYDDNKAVGCASYKKYDNENAELKRVFVKENYRGQGISNYLLENIEEYAKKQGFQYMILESGEILASAMALYRKKGYKVIPNYGQYANMDESVCMKKKL